MRLHEMSTERLIQCYVSQTEPVVQADHPYAVKGWREWMAQYEYSLDDVAEELERRHLASARVS